MRFSVAGITRLAVLGGAALLSACASSGSSSTSNFFSNPPAPALSNAPYGDCENALTRDQELDLFVALQMANEDRLFAALAHLDYLPPQAAVTRYWRADLQRRLGHPDAQAGFTSLIGTCLDGRAKHGLGLLAAQRGQWSQALTYLAEARRIHPDNANIRNDYGYVLFLTGNSDTARFELFTAVELENGRNQRALDNLIMVLLHTQRYSELQQVVNRYPVTQEDVWALEEELGDLQFVQVSGPL